MPATEPIVVPIDDPAELAYWAHRRLVRRRRLCAIAIATALALAVVGWKVLTHLSAAWWLGANQYVVIWSAEGDDRRLGGSTIVRYASRQGPFSSERPLDDLRFLGRLHRLRELDLASLANLRDADLPDLGEFTAMRRLNLDRSHQSYWSKEFEAGLTDATLARIGRLHRLVELSLGGQAITDAGLRDLEGLSDLRSLDLESTGITDAGLGVLKALPALRSLDLTGTKVTARGVAAFEASRPEVRILTDLPPIPFDPGPKAPR